MTSASRLLSVVALLAAGTLLIASCTASSPTSQSDAASASSSPATSAAQTASPLETWCTNALPEASFVGAGLQEAKFGAAAPTIQQAPGLDQSSDAFTVDGVECFWSTGSSSVMVGRMDLADVDAAADDIGLTGEIWGERPVSPDDPSLDMSLHLDDFDQVLIHRNVDAKYTLMFLTQGATVFRGAASACTSLSVCENGLAALLSLFAKSPSPEFPQATCAASRGDELRIVVLSDTTDSMMSLGLVDADGKARYVIHQAAAAYPFAYVFTAEPVTSSETSAAGPVSVNGVPVDLTGQYADRVSTLLTSFPSISAGNGQALITTPQGDGTAPFTPGRMHLSEGAACTSFDI